MAVESLMKCLFTPKHASWLNIIESFFQENGKKRVDMIKVDSINELRERITQYIN